MMTNWKNYISLLCTKTKRLESECKNLNMLRVNDHHTVHNSIINICVRSDQIRQRSLMLYLNQDTRSPSSFYAHNNHDSPDLQLFFRNCDFLFNFKFVLTSVAVMESRYSVKRTRKTTELKLEALLKYLQSCFSYEIKFISRLFK